MTIHRITIVGTGLIGASVGLALRASQFPGEIVGWDRNPSQLQIALDRAAIDVAAGDPLGAAVSSDIVLLSGPVLAIQDWMERLAPLLKPHQLVTDVGSVKVAIAQRAQPLFGGPGQAGFLPGHPMAGKEVSGAAHADAALFAHAVWLFTEFASHPLAAEWRGCVQRFGCRTMEIEAARHDEICAWVSHLPQLLATGLSGMALEQRLAYLRENLKTPELRDEFERANRFRTNPPAGT